MAPSTCATFEQTDRDFVYRVACRIVDPEAAEDVAQDAMLLAFRHRDAFRGDARYHTWLYRIAATAALGYLRKRRRAPELLAANEELPDAADPARSPEAMLADRQQAAAALATLERLSPMYRDVVVLRMELSEVDTAKKLGITVSNVKVRAHRARHMLQQSCRPVNDQLSACATPG